jgi:hypothetical protein
LRKTDIPLARISVAYSLKRGRLRPWAHVIPAS